MSDELDSLVAQLEAAAARLRAGEVEGADAAAMVERCAELASEVAADLERRSRELHDGVPDAGLPEQERLL